MNKKDNSKHHSKQSEVEVAMEDGKMKIYLNATSSSNLDAI